MKVKKALTILICTVIGVSLIFNTNSGSYALGKEPIEIISKRSEYEKHFDNGDGTIAAFVNKAPLHYSDNGEWKEIDNTLIPDNSGNYVNKNNSMKVTLSSETYLISYKDIDTTNIDAESEKKRAEYLAELYKQDLTEQEVERLSTEYYNNQKLEMLKAAYSEMSAKVLEEIGISSENVFCSMYSPTIICPLTNEQLKLAESSELVENISAYTPANIQECSYSTKDEFISLLTEGKDTKELFGQDVKISAELNCKKDNSFCDYFIIYGLKNSNDIMNVISKFSANSDFNILISGLGKHSGTQFLINSDKVKTSNAIYGFVFVDDEYPNINTITSISFFKNLYNFNPLPYIVNIGDADGNFMIDVSDASDVLTLYAKLATTEGLTPTAEQLEHCDVDSDGQITALDASHILTYYAFISTGGEGSFKDFINKYVLTSTK